MAPAKAFPSRRWLRVTVLPGCAGCRTVAVPASWTVRDVKRRLAAETGFPASEQRLWLGGRQVGRGRPAGRAGTGPGVGPGTGQGPWGRGTGMRRSGDRGSWGFTRVTLFKPQSFTHKMVIFLPYWLYYLK